jgi:hypothetical protein
MHPYRMLEYKNYVHNAYVLSFSSVVLCEFTVLSFLDSTKQFLNIGVSPALIVLLMFWTQMLLKSSRSMWVNAIRLNKQVNTQVHWWEGGKDCSLVWANFRGEGRGMRSSPGSSELTWRPGQQLVFVMKMWHVFFEVGTVFWNII